MLLYRISSKLQAQQRQPNLKRRLAEQAGRILAIEIDHKSKPLHEELFVNLARPPELLYQFFGQLQRARTVPRTAFFPKPQVTSVLMTLTPSGEWQDRMTAFYPRFHRFLTGLMQYRRKTLTNTLKQLGMAAKDLPSLVQALGHQSEIRSEQLTPHELGSHYRALGLSDHI